MERIISAEISILDEIDATNGIGLKLFKAAFDRAKNAESILLYLNSPGGSCFEATGIYSLLSSVRSKLTVQVCGLAASAASILALAGKKLVMTPQSFLMIHLPYLTGGGRASELRKNADILDTMTKQYISIYREKTGLTESKILAMLEAETWLDAPSALRLGFCDEITEESGRIAARVDPAVFAKYGYKHAPKMMAAKVDYSGWTAAMFAARIEEDKALIAERERKQGAARHREMLELEASVNRSPAPKAAPKAKAVELAKVYDVSGCGGSARAGKRH